jgi:uncharacterized membrane protein YhhN
MPGLKRHLPLFVATALVATALYVYGLILDDFNLRIATKAFPVLAMMAFVSTFKTRYAKGILIGLGLCLLGDMLLEFRQRFFLPGMIAFMLGHVAYCVTFIRRNRHPALPLALPFLVWIAWALYTLWSGLGSMQVPVAAYTLAIFVMMWRAAALVFAAEKPQTADWAVMVGASLFAFSDTLIALDRFHAPIDGVRIPIILTYWAAQLGITASVTSANIAQPEA